MQRTGQWVGRLANGLRIAPEPACGVRSGRARVMAGGTWNIIALARIFHCLEKSLWALRESSVRSGMFIAKSSEGNQAPSGAACRARVVTWDQMPLLTELENSIVGPCFYKHAAPNGAIAALPKVYGASGSVPLVASELRARGPASRQTGGLPHAPP